jgi:hypothetical protein
MPCPWGRAVRVPVALGREGHQCQERGPHASRLLTTAIALVPEGRAGPPRCAVHVPPAAEKTTAYAPLAFTRLRLDPLGPTAPPAPPRPATLVCGPWPARARPPSRRLVGDAPLGPPVRARGDGRLPGAAARTALRGVRSRWSPGGAARGGPQGSWSLWPARTVSASHGRPSLRGGACSKGGRGGRPGLKCLYTEYFP